MPWSLASNRISIESHLLDVLQHGGEDGFRAVDLLVRRAAGAEVDGGQGGKQAPQQLLAELLPTRDDLVAIVGR
eukprot:scaffold194638_cov48-Prasinocladus_malaysianus.AAC.1